MRAVALLIALMSAACAAGRPAPEPSRVVPIRAGLTYLHGSGTQGCNVTLPHLCTATTAPIEHGQPELLVVLAPFAIDAHEVTNEQYRHCVETGPCSQPADRATSRIAAYYGTIDGDRVVGVARYSDYPVVHVTWQQAAEYCKWVGKRLPTEHEFERAASGAGKTLSSKRIYPWVLAGPKTELGDCKDRDVNLYGCRGEDRPGEVGSFGDDRVLEDGEPIWDLTGNVMEWTANDADPRASCDHAQAYSCGPCAECIDQTLDPLACKIECSSCACGGGGAGPSNSACYNHCAAPVCPLVPAIAQPVKAAPPTDNTMVRRVVKGGSFAVGSGSDGARRCEGRADHRVLDRRFDDAGEATGFRCAKTLTP